MKFSNTKAITSQVLAALTLAIVSLAGLPGKAEAATCLTCHAPVGSVTDIRPAESNGFRNITTGSIRGSHARHIQSATLDANVCSPCHGAAASGYLTNHRDGFITVTSAGGIGYSKNTSFPQSGAKYPVLGTCSTASCHANVYGPGTILTPVWGSTNYGSSCNTCHKTLIGSNGPATGSHAKHSTTCTLCHSSGTTTMSMPSSGHMDNNITIVNVGYPVTVAKHAAGSGYTSCSTASCHLNVYGAGTVTTPVWGESAGCSACHTIPIGPTGPATGSHVIHNNSTCTDCHYTGTTATSAPSIGHKDGTILITNSGYGSPAKHAAGSYTGTCTTTCHSATTQPGTDPGVVTPVWGSTSNCASCHAIEPTTGSHMKHMTYIPGALSFESGHRSYSTNIYLCADCHAGAVQGSNAGTGHVNNNIDVTNGYPATVAKHNVGSGYSSCATSYCHSSGQSLTDGNSATPVYAATPPAWGGTVGCGNCHPTWTSITSGSHAKHINNDSQCDNCHAGAVSGAYLSPNHINRSIDVDSGLKYELSPGVSASGAPGNGYGTCSTSTCHDNGKGVSVPSPVWGASAAPCTACHELSPTTGSHAAHLTNPNQANKRTPNTFACRDCHAGVTQGGPANATDHLDGNIDVYKSTAGDLGYLVNKTKGTAPGTCATTYCHSSGQGPTANDAIPVFASTPPTWGSTISSNCNGTCHVTTGISSGSHTVHLAPNPGRCDYCHTYAGSGGYYYSNHINGLIDVGEGSYTKGGAPGNGYGTCSTTSCHTDVYSNNTFTTPEWGTATATGCSLCHTVAIGATGPATGSHAAHNDSTCTDCHAAGTTSITKPGTGHLDGSITV
ncbi:MAG: CxxxxCH/CxxCH domain-containing protein, partial [Desulfuromonadaceae bacterium]|nr:CxxxxCH/CxxCH domain-containing protein [Desulfuromonadaceae bacterium]